MASATPDTSMPRLDVRLHGGRTVSYPLRGDFLIGAAGGCDLRLPDATLPPVVCQLSAEGDGLRVRRVAAVPMRVNGEPVAAMEPFVMNDGDRLEIGPVEITAIAAAGGYLHPRLVPLEVDDLAIQRAALEQQARELEEDRRLWYARRQEMQAEIEQLRAQARTPDAEAVRSAQAALKDDLLLLERRQASLEAREAAVNERYAQLSRDAAELEEQLHLAHAEEERLTRERERLERLKADVEAQAAKFAERSAQVESQQALLAVLRAKLDRQEEEQRRERAELDAEKQRQEAVRRELDERFREADLLRAEIGFLKDDSELRQQAVAEQQAKFAATLEDFCRHKASVEATEAALAEREREIDAKAAETLEQAATLKAKLVVALELQERLEADRAAIRERESALAEAEAARQALAEQLRKRAEDLGDRGKTLEAATRELAEERARLEALRAEVEEWRRASESALALQRNEIESRAAEVDRQSAALAEREAALGRQIERMREASAAIAAERKALAESQQQIVQSQRDSEAQAIRATEQVAELRRQAPEIEQRATAMLERLAAAREVLRGHLAELHEFARQSRQSLQAESESLRQREERLDQAQAEHRVAVSEFRQQMLGWQAKVAELQKSLSRQDASVTGRRQDLEAAEQRLSIAEANFRRRLAEMEEEQRLANEKRNEMERHLADMREWYRRKLRELAAGREIDDSDMPAWEVDRSALADPRVTAGVATEDDPADQHLSTLLRSRGLVDSATLTALENEARRQRRTLRQTLLASGVVTLYQLALIEAGNLEALTLGRFRVIDRVRGTAQESVYRVYDPMRPTEALVLRVLSEEDESRREEFRQGFRAATAVKHANLANVLEVVEVSGRPAALLESVSGLPSSDWPALVASPGVWLRLVTEAAKTIAHLHAHQVVHGRLQPESFILMADGTLKLVGLGEPSWLGAGTAIFDPRPVGDLQALGRIAYGWSQIGAKRRVSRGKAFPAELAAVVRRLEAGAESPMGDVVALDKPFSDAAELLRLLDQLSFDYPCPDEAWQKLLRAVSDEPATPLRQSA